MTHLKSVLQTIHHQPFSILDTEIPVSSYHPVDLSITNAELNSIDITNPTACQRYIETVLARTNGLVAYGGYQEKRNLYANADRFLEGEARDIHLGIDFWCKAGTKVMTPLQGKVHSFKNNSDRGNYGPTIILEHLINEDRFYSLYGHLSVASLEDLYIGKPFEQGQVLGYLGDTPINVNYAPHLHFQLIIAIQYFQGDYPGVCNAQDLKFYQGNCPDPNLLLGF